VEQCACASVVDENFEECEVLCSGVLQEIRTEESVSSEAVRSVGTGGGVRSIVVAKALLEAPER